jgi:glycosyltransferase involved in cell wall biosynthesis
LNISVIIPTYNRARILKESIQSVLEQTLSPMEVIIVDDFSTDNTQEIVESFNNEKVRYMKNERSKGANGARNTGILKAKGDYIAFQDSDDIWLNNKLEKQSEYMRVNSEVDMCFCSINFNNGTRIIPKRKVEPDEINAQLRKGNFISTQTIFVRTSVAKDVLFDEGLKRFQDWDFCLRLSKKYVIHHVHEPLVLVEQQEDSIGKKVSGKEALEQLFKKHPELLKETIIKGFYFNESYIKYRNENKIIKAYLKYFLFIYYKIVSKLYAKDSPL